MRASRAHWLAVAFIAFAPAASAQREPHIGYAYPAGARRGAACEVTIGGQFLDGVNAVYLSGGGVHAEVMDHIKPMNGRQLSALRQRIRQLRNKGRTAKKSDAQQPGEKLPPVMYRGKNIYELSAKEVAELRARYNDPRKQLNPQIAEIVRLRIALESGALPGERELRLGTPSGLTNPIRFEVSAWSEHLEKEPNDKAPDDGIGAERPVVLNGQIMPGDVDRFRFSAKRGEHLVVATSARRLIPYLADAVPGWFQATLALYDAQGQELAFADDYRFHPDPILYYEVPADGEYALEIRDSIYRGREDFVYRIALGELPFVTSIFPLGGRAGERSTVALDGWNLPTRRLSLDGEAKSPGIHPVALNRGETFSNSKPFAVDALPECAEKEPNSDPRRAQKLTLPQIVNGRIEKPGDRDVFSFEARAGEQLVAEVLARRLDSPLDSILVLTDAQGREIASNDDHVDRGAGLTTHHADSLLSATIPADGSYYLHLRDAQEHGGKSHAYRLRLSAPRPDFELRVVPASISLGAGQTLPLTVYALRKDGFDGDIALSLADAPQGFRLSGAWVPAGQDRVTLTLSAPPTPQKEPIHLALVGRAVTAGGELRHEAVPAEDMMQAFLYRHLVPADELMVVVTNTRARRLSLRLRDTRPAQLPAGGSTRVLMGGLRTPPRERVMVQLREPPDGITIGDVQFTQQGIAIVLNSDASTTKPGLKGNLIVEVFVERAARARGGKKTNRKRRVSVGVLPAIPFEVVEA